jgi:peptidase M23-like protein
MVYLRTTARGLLTIALFGLLAGTAAGYPDYPVKYRPSSGKLKKPVGKTIVFPVIGPARLTQSFGDPRGQGSHQGEDIMSVRRAVAVASEAGKVRFYSGSSRAGCMLYLYADSGTKYLYIHLNNDLTNGNDNRGRCVPGTAFAVGLKDGQRVLAGQPIGFVGDSGDANGVEPHLHYEIHPGGGAAADPYPYLRASKRLLFYAPPGSIYSLQLAGRVLAVGTETLRVKLSVLRTSFGMTIKQLARPLTVTVPVGSLVERGRGTALRPASLGSAKAGEAVSVWTEPAQATAEAQAGKDGALSAERVLLPPAA